MFRFSGSAMQLFWCAKDQQQCDDGGVECEKESSNGMDHLCVCVCMCDVACDDIVEMQTMWKS